jgi:hypothetical protein
MDAPIRSFAEVTALAHMLKTTAMLALRSSGRHPAASIKEDHIA